MRVELFDFELPEERIALAPVRPRDAARMLVVMPPAVGDGDAILEDRIARELVDYLRPGDVLVFNDTRVIAAELSGVRRRTTAAQNRRRESAEQGGAQALSGVQGSYGVQMPSGVPGPSDVPGSDGALIDGVAHIIVNLHKRLDAGRWLAFARPARRLKPGDRIEFTASDPGADLAVSPAAPSAISAGASSFALAGASGRVDTASPERSPVGRGSASQPELTRDGGSLAATGSGLGFELAAAVAEDTKSAAAARLDAIVEARGEGGEVQLCFSLSGEALDQAIAAVGQMPLPPYIASKRHSGSTDARDYQTIYASCDGAVAAPTAGLHFTDDLMARIDARGVSRLFVTLHVGAGTFLPVKAEDTAAHVMHSEWGSISRPVADALNTARAAGGRIVAVGTTSLRLLESAASEAGEIRPFAGETDIFITPGYRFRAVDLLMTNFHLPRSTLFMLVSAFSGRETMQAAYAHAIAAGYRFYSYGDACLLHPTTKSAFAPDDG